MLGVFAETEFEPVKLNPFFPIYHLGNDVARIHRRDHKAENWGFAGSTSSFGKIFTSFSKNTVKKAWVTTYLGWCLFCS